MRAARRRPKHLVLDLTVLLLAVRREVQRIGQLETHHFPHRRLGKKRRGLLKLEGDRWLLLMHLLLLLLVGPNGNARPRWPRPWRVDGHRWRCCCAGLLLPHRVRGRPPLPGLLPLALDHLLSMATSDAIAARRATTYNATESIMGAQFFPENTGGWQIDYVFR